MNKAYSIFLEKRYRIVDAVDCDYKSYKDYGLFCCFCKHPVFLAGGCKQVKHFRHFKQNKDNVNNPNNDCELYKSSKYTTNSTITIQVNKQQLLTLLTKKLNNILLHYDQQWYNWYKQKIKSFLVNRELGSRQEVNSLACVDKSTLDLVIETIKDKTFYNFLVDECLEENPFVSHRVDVVDIVCSFLISTRDNTPLNTLLTIQCGRVFNVLNTLSSVSLEPHLYLPVSSDSSFIASCWDNVSCLHDLYEDLTQNAIKFLLHIPWEYIYKNSTKSGGVFPNSEVVPTYSNKLIKSKIKVA